ncbi:MAG: hypothetical protein AB8G11_17275 [Saprospiraceae bacterium]
MFQKILLISLMTFIFNVQSFSQGFQKSVGFSGFLIKDQQQRFMAEPLQRPPYEVLTPKSSSNDWAVVGHLNPRFLLYNPDSSNIAFNLSIPMSIGASFQANSNGTSSSSLLVSLPVLIEFAYGHCAYKNAVTKNDFGTFIAIGYNLNFGAGSAIRSYSSFNPHARIGIRTMIENRTIEIAYFQDLTTVYNQREGDEVVFRYDSDLNTDRYQLNVTDKKWIQGISISYIF